MSISPDAPNKSTEHLFRPSKKRKTIRRRPAIVAGDEPPTVASLGNSPHSTDPTTQSAAIDEDAATHVTGGGLVHRRRLANRRGGVIFAVQQSNSSQSRQTRIPREAGTPVDMATEVITHRFAPQTGQASAVADKHMTAYVDMELARMRAHSSPDRFGTPRSFFAPEVASAAAPGKSQAIEIGVAGHSQKEAATLGRLQEVDLGPDAHARNIALTEEATRRLQSNSNTPSAFEIEAKRPPKPRLGHNGKALPARRWKRRGSEDLARDSLVEALLSEARTEHVYENEIEGDSDDAAADERLAEQFRAEFMEQMEMRNAQAAARAAKPPETTGGGKGGERDEYAKGPKLGGSRMQRAAMRDKEIAAKKGPTNRGGRT